MPKPFSTTAEPASASARAIPSPMPLVDPVTSETLPASGRRAATPCVLSWIFMAVLSSGDSALYADHLRPTLPGRLHLRKCRLASKTIGPRYGGYGVIAGRDRLRCDQDRRGTAMEMHQVRYFLAVARVLNFTRAADECNVTQPSLTRAIKQLEAELGGDLFRRERPAAQLTELGLRMHPLLKQCYEAAIGARSLAASFKSGEVGALRIALTHAVDMTLLVPYLEQLKRYFNRLEFRLLRGTGKEVGELLKRGEAELGIAAEIDEAWDRLDSWPLFTEGFQFVVSEQHPLATRDKVAMEDLKSEQFLTRGYCEYGDRLTD